MRVFHVSAPKGEPPRCRCFAPLKRLHRTLNLFRCASCGWHCAGAAIYRSGRTDWRLVGPEHVQALPEDRPEPDHVAIVMDRSAGASRRVGAVVVDRAILRTQGLAEPRMLSSRALGVVEVLQTWEHVWRGAGRDRCAHRRARYDAQCLADTWNELHGAYAPRRRVRVRETGTVGCGVVTAG